MTEGDKILYRIGLLLFSLLYTLYNVIWLDRCLYLCTIPPSRSSRVDARLFLTGAGAEPTANANLWKFGR
jgi:hypothetical protein